MNRFFKNAKKISKKKFKKIFFSYTAKKKQSLQINPKFLDFFLIINAINIIIKLIILFTYSNSFAINGSKSFFKRLFLHLAASVTVFFLSALYCLYGYLNYYLLIKADAYLSIILCVILTALNVPICKYFKKNLMNFNF